ncbi:PspC domain-containing protein [Agromyces sp. NPDC055658]
METNQTAPEADSETSGSGPVPEDAMGPENAAGAADSTGRSAAAGPHADGAVGSAPDPSRDAHGGDPADRAAGPGFYAWLRRLGVPRRAGWLGGVCAGVGARLGIDPIVVRGIVVVIAVLGAPFVLVYAVAWLLLPDTEGEIHFERLTRGIVDPAVVGIAVMGVIGFIPLVQGGWLGWRWWPEWPAYSWAGIDLGGVFRTIWGLMIAAAIVVLVIWLVRRASQNAPAGGASREASAPVAGPGYPSPEPDGAASAAGSAGATGAAGAAAFTALASTPVSPAPASATASPAPAGEPPVPAEGADAATIAEWRARHEAWRESHAEWKAGQAEAQRAARQQAAEETRARALEFQAAAAAAREARRAARPRASAAFVFTMLGLALVAGAGAAIWALGVPDAAQYAVAIAFATATLVLSAAMIVAALWRRRSGALATLASVSVVAMLIATSSSAMAPFGTLLAPSASVSLGYPQQLVQPVGDAWISIGAYDGYPDEAQTVTLTQVLGNAYVTIDPHTSIVLDATDAGDVTVFTYDADGYGSAEELTDSDSRVYTITSEGITRSESDDADARLVLRQTSGYVEVNVWEGQE